MPSTTRSVNKNAANLDAATGGNCSLCHSYYFLIVILQFQSRTEAQVWVFPPKLNSLEHQELKAMMNRLFYHVSIWLYISTFRIVQSESWTIILIHCNGRKRGYLTKIKINVKNSSKLTIVDFDISRLNCKYTKSLIFLQTEPHVKYSEWMAHKNLF